MDPMGTYALMEDRTMLPNSCHLLRQKNTGLAKMQHMTSQNGDPGIPNQDADDDITTQDRSNYVTSQNGNAHSGDSNEKCPHRFIRFNIWSSAGDPDWKAMGLLGG